MEGSAGRVVPTGEQVLAFWFVFRQRVVYRYLVVLRCDVGLFVALH